jgi:hypothetical protein
MKKYFVSVNFGICGCYANHLIEAESLEAAKKEAFDLAVENAESYGFYLDEDYFGDLCQVGKDPDYEDEIVAEYGEIGELDWVVEEYNPKKHNSYL